MLIFSTPWLIAAPGIVKRRRARKRSSLGRCLHCNYDRNNLPPDTPCPECGNP